MITTINKKMITVFEMTGADVLSFLNNQAVSEIQNLNGSTRFTAICNPKGRVIYTLIISQHKELIYVAVDSSLSDNFLQYINMRRFRMDISIKKSTSLLGVDNTKEQPQLGNDVTFVNDSDPPSTDSHVFWLFIFKTGLPWITTETSELFIPQHLNLDISQVIDFNKGCYPGQEIVARLHFLGKIKKRMQYIQYESDHAYTLNSKVKIPEHNETAEICAPAVFHQKKWHSQAIIAV